MRNSHELKIALFVRYEEARENRDYREALRTNDEIREICFKELYKLRRTQKKLLSIGGEGNEKSAKVLESGIQSCFRELGYCQRTRQELIDLISAQTSEREEIE